MIKIKNEEQVNKIRKSSQLAAKTLTHVQKFVKPGISTDELNTIANDFILENNGISATLGYKGFPKSICTSINEVICHGIPSERVLKEGDIIKIDVATILDGYYGDTCATFPVGKISDIKKNLINVTKKCLEIGINQVKPGNNFDNIGTHIGKYAMLSGYSVVYQFCGHGVGIEFHESPNINHYYLASENPEIMKPGMIFTIEPMINVGSPVAVVDPIDNWTVRTEDKNLSAQFEHTLLVTETGVEILTV